MKAIEIEEAVSNLAGAPFEPETFPFDFLEAFGNKVVTLKKLKSGSSNQSDLGGVLQRNNIHLKVCAEGEVTATLTALRESGAMGRQKVKFILATDGLDFEAENLVDGETIASGQADVVLAFGTDGELTTLNLVLLEDDKAFYPPYHVAPVVRAAVLEVQPTLRDALNGLAP